MLKLETKQQECMHHWIIDSPDSHMSNGNCRLCGAVTEFSNSPSGAFLRRASSETAPGIEADHLQESSLD